MPLSRPLRRSKKDKLLIGVLGGIAEYFGANTTAIRVIFVAIMILSGFVPMTVAYFVAGFLMEDPDAGTDTTANPDSSTKPQG